MKALETLRDAARNDDEALSKIVEIQVNVGASDEQGEDDEGKEPDEDEEPGEPKMVGSRWRRAGSSRNTVHLGV